ncbi:unnamed protein product [Calypogeia fissa]
MARRKRDGSISKILCNIISTGSPESSGAWEPDWETEEEEERDEEARAEEESKKRRRRIKLRKAGPPVFGNNCHYCKREATHPLLYVSCWMCPLKFCGVCLLRKHGEDAEEEMQENVRWVCPICRGGCGPGCRMNCCACGPCRKYQQLEPAGRVFPAAVKAGFSNVHDYLVHFETGETPEVIAERKTGRGWTKATGAIDRTLDFNFTWAMKRMRSHRRRLPVASPRVESKSCSLDENLDEPLRTTKLAPEQPPRTKKLVPKQPSRTKKLVREQASRTKRQVPEQASKTIELVPDQPSLTVELVPEQPSLTVELVPEQPSLTVELEREQRSRTVKMVPEQSSRTKKGEPEHPSQTMKLVLQQPRQIIESEHPTLLLKQLGEQLLLTVNLEQPSRTKKVVLEQPLRTVNLEPRQPSPVKLVPQQPLRIMKLEPEQSSRTMKLMREETLRTVKLEPV